MRNWPPRDAGWRFVMVTNQDGLGTPSYPRANWDLIQNLLTGILTSQGVVFDAVLVCPHVEKDGCLCRKPQLGREAARSGAKTG